MDKTAVSQRKALKKYSYYLNSPTEEGIEINYGKQHRINKLSKPMRLITANMFMGFAPSFDPNLAQYCFL
jgi:hypothetical protein